MKKRAQSTRPMKREQFEITPFAEEMVERMLAQELNDIRAHGPWRLMTEEGWEGWLEAELVAKDDQRKTPLRLVVVAKENQWGSLMFGLLDSDRPRFNRFNHLRVIKLLTSEMQP